MKRSLEVFGIKLSNETSLRAQVQEHLKKGEVDGSNNSLGQAAGEHMLAWTSVSFRNLKSQRKPPQIATICGI